MKRLIGLFGVLAVGVLLTTATLKPREANALDAKLTGLPVSLNADELLVSSLVVEVKGGWVNSDAIALEIMIIGDNDTTSFRGHQIVPMTSTTPFLETRDRDLVHVLVPWDDQAPNVHADVYQVCVQVLAGGQPLGDLECGIFSVVQ